LKSLGFFNFRTTTLAHRTYRSYVPNLAKSGQ